MVDLTPSSESITADSSEGTRSSRGSSSLDLSGLAQQSPGNILYYSMIVDATTLRQWPQPYRATYPFIDGRRAALDIAHLRSRNLEDVIPFLDELIWQERPFLF